MKKEVPLKQDTESSTIYPHSKLHVAECSKQPIIHTEVTNCLGFIRLRRELGTIDTTKNSYWHPILHFIARLHTHTHTHTHTYAKYIYTSGCIVDTFEANVSLENADCLIATRGCFSLPSRGKKKKGANNRGSMATPLRTKGARIAKARKSNFCKRLNSSRVSPRFDPVFFQRAQPSVSG